MRYKIIKKTSYLFIILLTSTLAIGLSTDILKAEDNFKELRYQMVRNQIKFRGVKDTAVLKAMRRVARHKFVPQQFQRFAYRDRPLPIGYNQTISQPYIVALMTSLAKIKKGERVLEIGTGSGYQAAILAEICDSVYTIEIIEELGRTARKRLKQLGYNNIKVKIGDGYKGWKEYSPFDAIIVTAAPPQIPAALKHQLAENGRMVIPVGDRRQELKLLKKQDGKLKEESIIPVRFVPMIHGEEN